MSEHRGSTSGPAKFCSAVAAVWLSCGTASAQTPEQPLTTTEFNSTRPTPRIEYWQKRLAEIEARMAAPEGLGAFKLVFLGDSITDFWTMGENPWFPGAVGGQSVWAESFSGVTPETRGFNLGISGDRTEHVLHRIRSRSEGGLGQLDRPDLDPEVIVLMIGINNSWDAESPAVDSVTAGIRAVVAAVRARKPEARIVLQSLLPTNEPARNRDLVQPVNRGLESYVMDPSLGGMVGYLDLYPAFVDAEGRQKGDLFMDGVHPNAAGYRAWRDRLLPYLAANRP